MPFPRSVGRSKSLVVAALPLCIARWCIFGLALPSMLLFCYRVSFVKRFWRFLNAQQTWEAVVKRAPLYYCSAHFGIETNWFWRLSKILQSGGLVRSRPPLCRKLGPRGAMGFAFELLFRTECRSDSIRMLWCSKGDTNAILLSDCFSQGSFCIIFSRCRHFAFDSHSSLVGISFLFYKRRLTPPDITLHLFTCTRNAQNDFFSLLCSANGFVNRIHLSTHCFESAGHSQLRGRRLESEKKRRNKQKVKQRVLSGDRRMNNEKWNVQSEK